MDSSTKMEATFSSTHVPQVEEPIKCGYCTHIASSRGSMKYHLFKVHKDRLDIDRHKCTVTTILVVGGNRETSAC